MKKVAIAVVLGIILSWLFYPIEKVEKKEPPLTVWKVDKFVDVPPKRMGVVNQEKNVSIVNKKPTVSVFGFIVATVGETLKFNSDAKDEDGNITAYLWREGEKILGSTDKLTFISATEGEHTITLRVTDNLGAKSEDSIIIDVYAKADKTEYSKHRSCGCQSRTYTYYNSEGNISKVIGQSDKNGIDIEKYKYDEDGHLIEKHHLNYYEKGKIESDITTLYNKFGNQIERFGKDTDYSVEGDTSPLVPMYKKLIYDEENRLVQEISKKNGLVNGIENRVYNKRGNVEKEIYERYENGVLLKKDEYKKSYDANGNQIKYTQIEIFADGTSKLNSVEESTYNSENKLLTQQSDNDGDGTIDSSYLYEYDSENRVTKKEYTNSEKEVRINSYEYDSSGNKISERRENGVDENSLTLYDYNEQGKMYLSKIDSDGDGDFESITTNFYNKNGVKIKERKEENGVLKEEILYRDDGRFKESIRKDTYKKYIVDEESGKVLSLIESHYGKEMRTDYIYDDSGKLIKKVDENGEVLYSVEFKN